MLLGDYFKNIQKKYKKFFFSGISFNSNQVKKNNIFYEYIGLTQKDYFEIEKEMKLNTKELYKINNQWYNNY